MSVRVSVYVYVYVFVSCVCALSHFGSSHNFGSSAFQRNCCPPIDLQLRGYPGILTEDESYASQPLPPWPAILRGPRYNEQGTVLTFGAKLLILTCFGIGLAD